MVTTNKIWLKHRLVRYLDVFDLLLDIIGVYEISKYLFKRIISPTLCKQELRFRIDRVVFESRNRVGQLQQNFDVYCMI